MTIIIITFFLSIAITLITLRYKHLHGHLSNDSEMSGPQKFHKTVVPRIGGLSIYLSLLISSLILFYQNKIYAQLFLIILCGFPCFAIGFIEDLRKNIAVKFRFLGIIFSSILSGIFLNTWITKTGVPILDQLLSIQIICIIFTCFCITGIANAYNIIDGFNGLSSMVAIITIISIGYVSFKVGANVTTLCTLIVASGIFGFFIFNFPQGLIFLGDGGAYLIGYIVGCLSILLVNENPAVSPYFAVLVNAYPITETIFSIFRKISQGKSPTVPDGMHFHSLIYRKLIKYSEPYGHQKKWRLNKNSKTSPYLWLISTLSTFPAIIWWNNSMYLIICISFFVIIYIFLYISLTKSKIHRR